MAIPKNRMIKRKNSNRLFLKNTPKLRKVTRFRPVTGLEGSVNRLKSDNRRNKPAETLNMMPVPWRARYPTIRDMVA